MMSGRSIREQYFRLLRTYIDNQQEELLSATADLGRELVRMGYPPEDTAEIHEEALDLLGREYPDMTLMSTARLVSAPLIEMVMAYGLAFREQQETRKRAEERIRRQSSILDAINRVFRETLRCETDEGVARTCLAVAEELTGSKFGFIGEVNQDGRFDTIALSDPGWDACQMPESDAARMIRDMEIRGIWGRVLMDGRSLIANEPASHPDRTGTPEGHPPITSFLGVPLKREGKTIGMIALANKKGGYTLADQEDIESLFVAFLEALSRKRAQELFRQSEERYRTLFEESKDGVYITTTEGRLVDINPAGIALFGYDSKEDLLKVESARDFYVNPSDREKYQRMISEQGFVKDYELVLKRKDGQEVTVLLTASAARDDEGNIVAYRGIIRDITEQRQLEQQFIHAQKMESIGTLAGGIAHDFNHILNGILGYATLMKMKTADEHPFFEYIEGIEKAVTQASELTAHLLAFARDEKYDVKPVDLNSIVHETLNIIGRSFDRSIQIETHLCDPLPSVEADSGRIQQVVMNLCVNARDAMSDGGSLIVETKVESLMEDYADTPGGTGTRSYVMLSVTDTGTGIDREVMQKIFEPFFTTKEKVKGTGLGLSMVYSIVKNHGGFVRVYSEPGEGSIFRVYLPASERLEVEGPAATEALAGRNELILFVDDDERMRFLGRKIFESYGYRVLLAADGVEAIEAYREHGDEVALVILDMVMPRMGGRETFFQLKELDPKVKVILTSGYSKYGKTREILESDAVVFIQKPYRTEKLLSEMRTMLDSTG